jgi:polyisoprenoid-binding protein YceI
MRMLRPFVPSLAMLLLATSGSAAQSVLIDQSEIRFVSKQRGANVEGRFRKWKARVDWRPDDLGRSRADFEIDVGSIDLRNDAAETEIGRPRWFDTAKYPSASFLSSAVVNLGGERYQVMGELTMKGITRTVTIPVQLRRDAAGNAVSEGQFTIKRLDFNVGEGPWSDSTMVADDVLVLVRVVLPLARAQIA